MATVPTTPAPALPPTTPTPATPIVLTPTGVPAYLKKDPALLNTEGKATTEGYKVDWDELKKTTSETTQPLELMKKLAQDIPGVDLTKASFGDRILGYKSDFPTDPKDKNTVTLETWGSPPGPPYFKAKMTFKIDVGVGEPTGLDQQGKPVFASKATIEFTQDIKTTVRVPLDQDDRKTHDEKMKALFFLSAYRDHIGEPLLERDNKRIQAVAKQTIIKMQAIRQQKAEGFYGKKVRPEKDPSTKTLWGKVQAYFRHEGTGSITAVALEGIAKAPIGGFSTLWNLKVSCPPLDERDNILKALQEATNDTERKAAITRLRASLKDTQIHAMLAINAAHAIEQLDIGLQDSPLAASSTEKKAIALNALIDLLKSTQQKREEWEVKLKNYLEDPKLKTEHPKLEEKLKGIIDEYRKNEVEYAKSLKRTEEEIENNVKRQEGLISALKSLKASPDEKENIKNLEALRDRFQIVERHRAMQDAMKKFREEQLAQPVSVGPDITPPPVTI